ncbi:MAG: sigma factor-like helix-turn-helix DNA-binding protein, partial [Candidatus Dormibacteraceae bacterium]
MTRRQRWWSVLKLAEIPSWDSGPETSPTDLRAALLELSPQERFPLVLHFYLDLPQDEVARALRVSLVAPSASPTPSNLPVFTCDSSTDFGADTTIPAAPPGAFIDAVRPEHMPVTTGLQLSSTT